MNIIHKLCFILTLLLGLSSSAIYPLINRNDSEMIIEDFKSSERSSSSSSIRSMVPTSDRSGGSATANTYTYTTNTRTNSNSNRSHSENHRRNLLLDRPLSVIVDEELPREPKFKRPATPAKKKPTKCDNSCIIL